VTGFGIDRRNRRSARRFNDILLSLYLGYVSRTCLHQSSSLTRESRVLLDRASLLSLPLSLSLSLSLSRARALSRSLQLESKRFLDFSIRKETMKILYITLDLILIRLVLTGLWLNWTSNSCFVFLFNIYKKFAISHYIYIMYFLLYFYHYFCFILRKICDCRVVRIVTVTLLAKKNNLDSLTNFPIIAPLLNENYYLM